MRKERFLPDQVARARILISNLSNSSVDSGLREFLLSIGFEASIVLKLKLSSWFTYFEYLRIKKQ